MSVTIVVGEVWRIELGCDGGCYAFWELLQEGGRGCSGLARAVVLALAKVVPAGVGW